MKLVNQNRNQIFTPLNSDCHQYVIDICHRYGVDFPPRQLKFIEVAYDKHKFAGEPFSRFDFPHLTRNNFSQMISRINKKLPLIEKMIDGYPPFYSLMGISFDKNVIENGTGVNTSFMNHRMEQLYMLATKQPPQMHDIKLSSKTSQLYENLLLQQDISPHPKNKQFIIPILSNPRFTSKAQISPTGRMDLHIGCSQNPLFCSIDGFSDLLEYIGEVKEFLKNRANSTFISQPGHDWIFEYYHFNRDSEPLIDPTCRFSVGDHFNYFYIKKLDNGKTVARVEGKPTPKTTVEQEIENILKPVYQKASGLQKEEEER